jgi:nitrate reductase NapAB chaperone NapD
MREVHISSLMIYVAKEDLAAVTETIKRWKDADVVRVDGMEGRLTVVIETDAMQKVRFAMNAFKKLDGVAQVILLFHNAIRPNSKQSITA